MFKRKKKEEVKEKSINCETRCTTTCTFNVGEYIISITEGDNKSASINRRNPYAWTSAYLYINNKEELKELCKGILSKLGEYELRNDK